MNNQPRWRLKMPLCPVALVAGCVKCPVVRLCPLKEVIGNYVLEPGDSPAPDPAPAPESTPTEEEGAE